MSEWIRVETYSRKQVQRSHPWNQRRGRTEGMRREIQRQACWRKNMEGEHLFSKSERVKSYREEHKYEKFSVNVSQVSKTNKTIIWRSKVVFYKSKRKLQQLSRIAGSKRKKNAYIVWGKGLKSETAIQNLCAVGKSFLQFFVTLSFGNDRF